LVASQIVAHRTGKPPIDPIQIKSWALEKCSHKPFVIETADVLRSSIFGMFEGLGKTNG